MNKLFFWLGNTKISTNWIEIWKNKFALLIYSYNHKGDVNFHSKKNKMMNEKARLIVLLF